MYTYCAIATLSVVCCLNTRRDIVVELFYVVILTFHLNLVVKSKPINRHHFQVCIMVDSAFPILYVICISVMTCDH